MKTSTFHTYEPEDLERLMRTKAFEELLPEERDFVLRHVENSDEYKQVRQLMIDVESVDHDLYDPPQEVWKNLQHEFRKQKKSLFVHWLNLLAQRWSEFTSLQRVAYSGLAMAAVVTLLALPYIAKQDLQSLPVILSENHNENSIQPELKNSVPTITKPIENPAQVIHLAPPVNDVYSIESYDMIAESRIEAVAEKEEAKQAAPADDVSENISTGNSENRTVITSTSHLPANANVSNYLYDSAPTFNVNADAVTITANSTVKLDKTKAEATKDSTAKIPSKSVPVKKKKKKKTH
jgi:hypothetical protein